MKKIYTTPKICVITSEDLCDAPFKTGSPAARTGGRAKSWNETYFDDDTSDSNIYHTGTITAGGFESNIPKPQSVWDD